MKKYQSFTDEAVEQKFASYPAPIKNKLLFLRQLIFDVAATMPQVGALEETLKWGEPSYVTSQTKSGSTVRINWKPSTPQHYAMYFNCKTSLVETFKQIYGNLFDYGGNRSILFSIDEKVPKAELADCIARALTYHLNKK